MPTLAPVSTTPAPAAPRSAPSAPLAFLLILIAPISLAEESTSPASEAIELGRKQYESACVACHQPDGRGIPSLYPPLANSEWVSGKAERLAAVVVSGLTGPIVVNGQTYGTIPMPGFGPDGSYQWPDREIAAVLSYVRQAWGNEADPVPPDLVTGVRESLRDTPVPLTAERLDELFPVAP